MTGKPVRYGPDENAAEMLCARKLVPVAGQRSRQAGRKQNDRARLWHFSRRSTALSAISLLLVAARSCAGARGSPATASLLRLSRLASR